MPSLLTLPSLTRTATTFISLVAFAPRARNASVMRIEQRTSPACNLLRSGWHACSFAWFEEHGSKIVSRDADAKRAICESPTGERASEVAAVFHHGRRLVSERSAELVQQLATRASSLSLSPPRARARSWSGGRAAHQRRVLLRNRLTRLPARWSLDADWVARFEHICGPLERELDVDSRPEPLWQFFRSAEKVAGLKCDSRSYYRLLCVDTKGDDTIDAALRACIDAELPEGVDWAMNLGKYDFYPRASGKGNVVAYLQEKFGVTPDECACLFDDDNDLPMAQRCGTHLLPGLTSDSVARAAMEHPEWQVASRSGQGVFAIEECLEQLLERVRREKSGSASNVDNEALAAK